MLGMELRALHMLGKCSMLTWTRAPVSLCSKQWGPKPMRTATDGAGLYPKHTDLAGNLGKSLFLKKKITRLYFLYSTISKDAQDSVLLPGP